ncbi:MAG: response regulator transcription factor [Candidatus Eremiobacteraeota bacterium]|nr:response regulator transcription factor [Candidatus Eremiobacteraeota bacterium]
MASVYIVEPQSLFEPELERLVSLAGARVAGSAAQLDLDEIIAAAPDAVLLDLDFTAYDVLDVLDVLQAEAPAIRPVVLTSERGRGRLDRCRAYGAAAVVSKDATDLEMVHDLRVVLDGGSVWDQRVEAA